MFFRGTVAVWLWLLSCIFLSVLQLIPASLIHLLHVSVFYDAFFISISSLLYLCLSVCSPAVIPPCSPPSVWIVCLLLLLTTIAIQTSALPHSFPSALETLILRLPTPLLTYPLLHSTPHLCNLTITFPLLTILNHLFFRTTLTTIALSLSIAPS